MTNESATEEVSVSDLLKSAKREKAYREKMYPQWIAQKRMRPEAAAHELACQTHLVSLLSRLLDEERGQGQLF